MRIDLKKFIAVGTTIDKSAFFQEAQALGVIEFIHPSGKRTSPDPLPLQKMSTAIKTIQFFSRVEQVELPTISDADAITERIIDLKELTEAQTETKRVLTQELERIRPYGFFSFEKVHAIEDQTNRTVHFYCAKSAKNLEERFDELVLINASDGIDYFITISEKKLEHPDLIELHFTRSQDEIISALKECEKAIGLAHDELKELTRYDLALKKALLFKINESSLLHAKECSEFELEHTLFYVEMWVPVNKTTEVTLLAKKHGIYLEEVIVEKDEIAPTYLENKGVSRVGEDLVRIFDMPANRDKDPSIWVLFFFSLFFSMIIFDGGYGLIFLAVSMFLHFKIKKPTNITRRFIALLTILAVSCTLWGGMTHSFFGITLSPDNPIRKYSMMTWLVEKKASYHIEKKDQVYQDFIKKHPELSQKKRASSFIHHYVDGKEQAYPVAAKLTDNVLLELALFIGALHLLSGLVRYLKYSPIGIGWILIIIGGYLYVPYYLQATSLLYYVFGLDPATAGQFGLTLVYAGLGLTAFIGVWLHGIIGIFECTHVIQVFGDVLSYLRIYALGTAAYIVAETVNHMAFEVPLFFAIILLIFGHTINILLSVMGGTIHGLRLNFLEWYRYSFYGGGKDFQPLKLHTLD